MESKLEEVERDYIEFRKEIEEEEDIKNEKPLSKNPGVAGNGELTGKE
jgi:hypothetical protein